MPEISVIIPVYNKYGYLDNLWKELIQQSFHDFECIIVDDGSTDGSGDKCNEIADKDGRFKAIHIDNGGVSHARNVALDCACGKYVTFIDADDSIHPDYLQNLYDGIVTHEVDMVISSSLRVWKDSPKSISIDVPFYGKKAQYEIMPTFVKNQTTSGIYGFCWGKMVKREIIGETRFDESINLAEDLDFYLSIYPKIRMLFFDDHHYYYYLQEAENSSMQKEDWEYDYYVQLKIQLKMRNMIEEMGFLNPENDMLAASRIWDYAFFVIYYSRREDIRTMCCRVRALQLQGIRCRLRERPFRQVLVLTLFLMRLDDMIELFLITLRRLKKATY